MWPMHYHDCYSGCPKSSFGRVVIAQHGVEGPGRSWRRGRQRRVGEERRGEGGVAKPSHELRGGRTRPRGQCGAGVSAQVLSPVRRR
jgi:hypothetical protein